MTKEERLVVDNRVVVEERNGELVVAGEHEQEQGRTVEERFAKRIRLNVPSRDNPKVARLIEMANADDELYALWLAGNVNAVERMGMTDHGPVHVKIVMNIASKLLRMLVAHGVEPGVVKHYGMTAADAEVVVVLASLLHDTGMSIHRPNHEEFSLFVAQAKLKRILEDLYDLRTATILRSEVLHAIIAHRSAGRPLTPEAGIVRVADALDMTKGPLPHPRLRGLGQHPLALGRGHRVGRDRHRNGEGCAAQHPHVQLRGRLPARPALPREARGERAGAVHRGGGRGGGRYGAAAPRGVSHVIETG
jgi:metal-dependent HD superfamily phosphatase/phosphodiesterase